MEKSACPVEPVKIWDKGSGNRNAVAFPLKEGHLLILFGGMAKFEKKIHLKC